MSTRLEIEPGTAALTAAGDHMGLYVEPAAGCVRLRWPANVAEFPFGCAWVEMLWDDGWVEGQGLMAVTLDHDGTHFVGTISLVDLEMTAFVAEGLRPEAWAVHDDDLDLVPPMAVERLLRGLPAIGPLRAPLGTAHGSDS